MSQLNLFRKSDLEVLTQGSLFHQKEIVDKPVSSREKSIKIKFDETDLKIGREVYEEELLSKVNSETLFQACIYTILSAAQDFQGQLKMFNILKGRGLLTPKLVLSRNSEVNKVVRSAIYYGNKQRRIREFAKWYLDSNAPGKLVVDVNNGKLNGFEIRKDFLESLGMKEKIATLSMNKAGYTNLVALDRWMMRAIRTLMRDEEITDKFAPWADRELGSYNGLLSNISRYIYGSSPTGSVYRKYEDLFSKIAVEHYGVEPFLLQAIFWGSDSTYLNIREKRTQTRLSLPGDLPSLIENEW